MNPCCVGVDGEGIGYLLSCKRWQSTLSGRAVRRSRYVSVKACRRGHAVTMGELLCRRVVGLLIRKLGGHSVRRCRPAVVRVFSTGDSLRTAAVTWSSGGAGRRGSVEGRATSRTTPSLCMMLCYTVVSRPVEILRASDGW